MKNRSIGTIQLELFQPILPLAWGSYLLDYFKNTRKPQIFAPDPGKWSFWRDLGLVQISASALSIKNLRVLIEIFFPNLHDTIISKIHTGRSR